MSLALALDIRDCPLAHLQICTLRDKSEAIPGNRLKSGHLKDQLFRSATGVSANYAEAEEPESRRDFVHKMKVAMKELSEARS